MRNCLIVGQGGTFANSLISRLDKEGWKVCTFSSQKGSVKAEHVFEHYAFAYSNESASRVIASCRPNVIIFLGAHDPAIAGDDHAAADHLHSYIMSLSTLLICAGKQGVRHFVYLSSEAVFENDYLTDIGEDTPATPASYRSTVIYQGENIASKYNTISNMEVTVVRLGGLCFRPANLNECSDLCASMCLTAIRGEILHTNRKHYATALYDSDAAEALFRLVDAPTRQHQLYHVGSPYEFNETDLALAIQEYSLNPVHAEDATVGLKVRRVLSGQRFDSEFHFSVRVGYREIVQEMLTCMQAQPNRYRKRGTGDATRSKYARIFRTVLPYLEALVGAVLAYVLTILTKAPSSLSSVNFFLLYSLLFAVFYGTNLGILTAFLGSVGYFIVQGQSQSALNLLIQMSTYIWIAQNFIVALSAGYVRNMLNQTRRDMKEETDFLSSRLKDVSNINDSNVQIKNFFEGVVVDTNEGMGNVYSIISELDNASNGAVLFAATDILMRFMGTKHVAIYQVFNGGYSRLSASTSPRARSLGKSLTNEKYKDIFNDLVDQRVYVNKKLDSDLPYLAGSLQGVNGEINFIVLLWDVSYDQMTLYSLNTLRIVCALISNAVTRSVNYLDAIAHNRMIDGTNILNEKAFAELVGIYRDASAKHQTEYCLLTIPMGYRTLAEWDGQLSSLLRFTDNVGVASEGSLGILLTNTNRDESSIVLKRLRTRGIDAQVNLS